MPWDFNRIYELFPVSYCTLSQTCNFVPAVTSELLPPFSRISLCTVCLKSVVSLWQCTAWSFPLTVMSHPTLCLKSLTNLFCPAQYQFFPHCRGWKNDTLIMNSRYLFWRMEFNVKQRLVQVSGFCKAPEFKLKMKTLTRLHHLHGTQFDNSKNKTNRQQIFKSCSLPLEVYSIRVESLGRKYS